MVFPRGRRAARRVRGRGFLENGGVWRVLGGVLGEPVDHFTACRGVKKSVLTLVVNI